MKFRIKKTLVGFEPTLLLEYKSLLIVAQFFNEMLRLNRWATVSNLLFFRPKKG